MTPEGKFRFPLGERKEALARRPPGGTLDDYDFLSTQLLGAAGNKDPLDNGESAVVDGEGDEMPVDPEHQSDERPLLQPDERGFGSYTDSGKWCGPHAGSTKPPNVDEAIWRHMYSAKDKR